LTPRHQEFLELNNPNPVQIAYSGVADISCFSGSKRTFRCPSAEVVDEWRETGLSFPQEFWLNSSYGINRFVVLRPPEPLTADPSAGGLSAMNVERVPGKRSGPPSGRPFFEESPAKSPLTPPAPRINSRPLRPT
jgi:hypothetical protein